ncbi:MAG: nucleotidyltransferase domain-containing protein [Prevotellaceae bacterium]|jgi:predicted nucleotidyltransferase|nr:nucleotidyltransferase domain-containing protein [Prevotellaceae bacterium]
MDIQSYIPRIRILCRRHKVNTLFAFGSVLTNRFNEQSDIDLLVDFKNIDLKDYVDNYYALRDELSRTLGRAVDLLEDKAIRNPILRRHIDESKILIYG